MGETGTNPRELSQSHILSGAGLHMKYHYIRQYLISCLCLFGS